MSSVHTGVIRVGTRGDAHIVDVSEPVRRIAGNSGILDGIVCVWVTGSTAAITTMEFEPGGVHDLRALLDRLIPAQGAYEHNRLNGDDNAHAHLRASVIGPSVSIPVVGGTLGLGTWQQVVLVDFDDRPRQRSVTVQIVG